MQISLRKKKTFKECHGLEYNCQQNENKLFVSFADVKSSKIQITLVH